ncbi:uncharacterized protein LY89DRAFT_714475 [Mollisia scopiformis]|uniref:Uncharacterized protein n=1 Tax=Mollisia scopiformis TaxID=149040 RepID=A0A194XSN1_MOLSC|nr:uncharacterized protein LY89DRAFT_714475 [Mollisia scopiformis]KUJ22737.1 hypothetical protein LY89DRAFT_714475 [Mollisia scopiformis]
MPSSTKVDLIVGIDFGMTCSGVAYARPKMKSPKLIQEWPGTARPGELNNKVPSLLLYGRDNSVKSWGFGCQTSQKKKEWFKRYLDERVFIEGLARSQQQNPDEDPPYATIQEVRKCYEDYMTCLYNHISDKIQKDESWESKRVEFIFSLPTTFTTPQITNSLRPLLTNAGFGTGGRRHSVAFGLTEPQASAVYTAVDQTTEFEDGDIMLVCDAGGGTTDLAILQKEGDDDDGTQLKELLPVAGYNFGSTNIDESFCALVEQRLQGAEGLELKENTAWTMMHSAEFQSWKRVFGTLDEKQFKEFPVKVPALKIKVSNEKAGITLGSMMFSHDDFKKLFDVEVDKMIKYIKNQMNIMSGKCPNKKIDYLVLSGGLGSSAYVQKRLKEAFTGYNAHAVAPSLKVIAAENDEPQLAVVKGLVWDQMQRQKTGKAVLKERIARASYGVVCDVPYDKKKDIGHTPVEDPIDGKQMLKGHIVWVIKKDHPISVDDAKMHEFTRVFPRGHSRKWKSSIVICHNDPYDLPNNTRNGKNWNPDVKELAEVESDLSAVSHKKFVEHQGKRSFFRKGEPYYEARYDVKFVIGAAADARFELWFQGQQWTSPNAIKIDWQEGANVPAHPAEASPKKFFSTGRSRRKYEWGTDDDD